MTPAPNTNGAFDFERYDLAHSNLRGWAACGVLPCLLSGFTWFAAWAADANKHGDEDSAQDDKEQQAA